VILAISLRISRTKVFIKLLKGLLLEFQVTLNLSGSQQNPLALFRNIGRYWSFTILKKKTLNFLAYLCCIDPHVIFIVNCYWRKTYSDKVLQSTVQYSTVQYSTVQYRVQLWIGHITLLKGTVRVISSNPACKDDNARLTTVP